MKINLKKGIILATTAIFIGASNLSLAYQSRPGYEVLENTSVNDFFLNIRKMEEKGGAFGLDAQISTARDKTFGQDIVPNNIDVHMIKNTEWGIAAMLASSDYGAGPGKVKSTHSRNDYNVEASSTNNYYGIYGLNNGLAEWEYVAGAITEKCNAENINNYLSLAPSRYVDKYLDGPSQINSKENEKRKLFGDATYETRNMAQGGGSFVSGDPIFIRGNSGIFYVHNYGGHANVGFGSRLAVWAGVDF